MIDCHSHLLPGIDDGARTMDIALSMARTAVASGITTAVMTPHHLNGVFTNTRTSILKAVAQFRLKLAEQDIPLNIYPGSELHLVPELLDQLQQGEAMTYADRGKAVLIELPKATVPTGSEQVLESILYRGWTPIIAHPERNNTLRRNRELVGEWVREGCKIQLTTQSCSGEFGHEIQSVCRYWCEQGWAHLIASDAHRPEGRAPDMRSGAHKIHKWLGEDATRLMTEEKPQRLLSGEDLHALPPVESHSRRRFSWFRRSQ